MRPPPSRGQTTVVGATDSLRIGSRALGKFLIVAHQRSGSSSLARYIRLCTGSSGIMEPFRAKYALKHGIDLLNSTELTTFLDEYFAKHDFAKHLYNSLPQRLNELIYRHYGARKMVFLYRKDLCSALISSEVARAAGKWRQIDDAELQPIFLPSRRFSKKLSTLCRLIESNYRLVQQVARSSKTSVLFVTYEDLYSSDHQIQQRVVQDILSFIGCDPSHWNHNKAFDTFISHKKKYTGNKTRLIRNYDELRNTFGHVAPHFRKSFWTAFLQGTCFASRMTNLLPRRSHGRP